VRGVEKVQLNTRTDEVIVTRSKPSATNRKILAVLKRMGFNGRVLPIEKTTLRVCGVDGEGKCERVRASLRRVAGIRRVSVTLTGRARVTYDSRHVEPADLVVAVRRAGFEAAVEG
jgi:copper chaperone CopZ